MKLPPQKAIEALEKIVFKIELWQNKYGCHDPAKHASDAKSQLLRLLRNLENK